MKYRISAGNNSTDLGQVGESNNLTEASNIAKKVIEETLPNGEGSYRIRDAQGRTVGKGEKSIRTSRRWAIEKRYFFDDQWSVKWSTPNS